MRQRILTFAGNSEEFGTFLEIIRLRSEITEGITIGEFADSFSQ